MKAVKTALIMLIFNVHCINAQVSLNPIGADAWGSGGQSVAQVSVFGVQNNPAAMVYLKKIIAGLYQEIKYKQVPLSVSAIALVLPGKYAHFGLGLVQQGTATFNQQKVSAGIAKGLNEQLAMGINFVFLGTHMEEQTYKSNFIAEFGLFIKTTSKLQLACFISNPTQVKYRFVLVEPIPSFVRAGFVYRFSSQFKLSGEIEHRTGFKNAPKLGIEYAPVPIFTLYAGWSNNPVHITFGMALQYKNARISLAASRHEILGITPHFSVVFEPGKSVKK
ncbi:MAG: hypothetical protein H7296_09375 [Bacteroidia bacterium]|nr:hypothetical protein [Bacteroidia bacterium]